MSSRKTPFRVFFNCKEKSSSQFYCKSIINVYTDVDKCWW